MHQSTKKTLPERVMEKLESEIIAGKYTIGGKIPTEPELVQHFQVSRNSVREAVQSLIHAGILEARQGSGTYVIATSRLQVELIKLCNKCETEEVNELRTILGKFLTKVARKRINRNEVKNLEEKATQLKDCTKNIMQTHAVSCMDSDTQSVLAQNTKNQTPQLMPAKRTKKDLSMSSQTILEQENSSTTLPNISLLRALDHEFTMALTQGAHNNVITPLFTCLQKQYLVHKVKEDKKAWVNNIKLYKQLADAFKKKDAKAIKKLTDLLYN